jgi:hypothetical protein
MNPNNCETCQFKQMNVDPELHCYMFKDEPTEVCMQHSGRTGLRGLGIPCFQIDDAGLWPQIPDGELDELREKFPPGDLLEERLKDSEETREKGFNEYVEKQAFPNEFPPMQMLEIKPDVSEFARQPDEDDEDYKVRLEALCGFANEDALTTLMAEEMEAIEDYEWRTITLPKIIKWYRKKLNKRKQQARARTGRRR